MENKLRFLGILCLLLGTDVLAESMDRKSAWVAVRSGSEAEWKRFLEGNNVDSLFSLRDQGVGLLHVALGRGEKFWTPLLDLGWPVAQEKDWTPQHEASLQGDTVVLIALIRAGAPVNVREPVNQGTPLHVAAFHGHLESVKILVGAGANVNARDGDGWTALSHARDQGFPKVEEWLKRYGATR